MSMTPDSTSPLSDLQKQGQAPASLETITIDGREVVRFHPLHKKIKDDIPRCVACGQIDEDGFHEAKWCPAMGGDVPVPSSSVKITLKADSGFRSTTDARLTLTQWRAIMMIVNANPEVERAIIDQDGNKVGTARTSVREIVDVHGVTDEHGTVWTPPTADAYRAICAALHAAKEKDRPND